MQIVRSNDLYRGLPYNFVQFTVLHEIMAGWLGVPLGTYRQVSDSLHVYAADEPQIQKSIPGSQPRNSDSLAIPKETSDAAFRDLMRCADVIVDERVSADQVMAMTERASLLPTFQNMLCVIAAEGARRRGRYDMCRTIMDRCTNQAYIALWQAWSLRGVAPAWAAPSDVSGA
jgi:thymidylate synthase